MGIKYYEETKTFKLDTPNTTYMFCIADDEGFILHKYYGRRLKDEKTDDLARITEHPLVPSKNNRERGSFMDCAPFEYPGHGLGDYREDAFSVLNPDGYSATQLNFKDYRIIPGKPAIPGLPATFEYCPTGKNTEAETLKAPDIQAVSDTGDDQKKNTICETLEIITEDKVNGLEAVLSYSIFEDTDAIARSVRIRNTGKYENIKLTKVLSASYEFYGDEYDTIFLHGTWARERNIDREHLGYGKHYVSSLRGESSHQEHPFLGLLARDADQDHGDVYGFSFVYSGNFIAQAERSQFDNVRVTIGINPEDFCWNLKAGEEFCTPEVVSVYSDEGLGKMCRNFHDLFRNHLIRSPYKDKKRPILINNWEATYFNFNTEKLISIAKEASKLGIELLVMDDGWFGHRDNDSSSLGDWYVNEGKLKGGLKYLVDEVNKLGMKFGIWMEPEMISPDSDLYRAHPDWAIHIPGRTPVMSREQYVLDLTRRDVLEYTYSQIKNIIGSANIEYLKWDMNRQLTDIGSALLGKESMGEIYHRYCLGVYELQERLITDFPNLLLENCSGGGARFDPGMLYYSPQIWTSDDMDPVERIKIHEGTALIYPLSAMGAHVCDCPNHSTGRTTPFETRGYVALAGTFGYELDVTRIPETDRKLIPSQIQMYHKYNDLVRTGDYYRVASYRENHEWDCWEVVSKDKSEALVTVINVLGRVNYKSRLLKLKGLDPDRKYIVKTFNIETSDEEDTGLTLNGDSLMYAGINIKNIYHGDFKGKLFHIISV